MATRTIQSAKKSSDINEIVRTFTPFVQGRPNFVDTTLFPKNLQEAHEIVFRADSAFRALPSEIRDACGNDPSRFAAYYESERGSARLVELGLKRPKAPDAAAQKAAADAAAEAAADAAAAAAARALKRAATPKE